MLLHNITKAVRILQEGGLVAFPTETVYGLGADAANEAAVGKIFQAKQRPLDHPVIVHIGSLAMLPTWARDISPAAQKLAQAFWPGPLTLILKKQPQVSDLVSGGQESIGLRVPRHPVAQALLQAFAGGVAAPSANRFGRISPTTAAAVYEELGTAVNLILDGGDCEVGLESTIVDMTGKEPRILRPGMITAEQIAAVLGQPVSVTQEKKVRTSGMYETHYAPQTQTLLVRGADIVSVLSRMEKKDLPLACLVWSERPAVQQTGVHWVKMSANPIFYARDLYQVLRRCDKQGLKKILIEVVPEDAHWLAITDRLLKATGGCWI